jgi:hypothetical protein
MEEKIQIIMRQTDYSEEVAKRKLIDHNNDEIKVIKEYFGIVQKPIPSIISINQEIYKQLRNKLNKIDNIITKNENTIIKNNDNPLFTK